MKNTRWKKFKIGLLSLSTLGLLAACNTTDEYEEDPEMGPPTEESVEDEEPLVEDEEPVSEDEGS